MRKWFPALCAIALMLGGTMLQPARALATPSQATGTVNPQIAAVLAQFPQGGPGLRSAVARLVEADASLAAAVVAASATATPEQKAAIGAGLADAKQYFRKIGSDWARYFEGLIETAMTAADPTVLAAYESVMSSQAQIIPGSNNNAGNMTSKCISPSAPGRGC